jgi:hypothetical protein
MDKHEFVSVPQGTPEHHTTPASPIVALNLKIAGWAVAVLGAATIIVSQLWG